MSIIVSDTGFENDKFVGGNSIVDVPSDFDPAHATAEMLQSKMIRVDFPSFADGRGFTIASQLRRMGYAGHLRAKGHILADQYAMARRAGFDDVEISDDLATRQGEAQWIRRAAWQDHSYQNRLRRAG